MTDNMHCNQSIALTMTMTTESNSVNRLEVNRTLLTLDVNKSSFLNNNFPALLNYNSTIDPAFLEKFNAFWLTFDPPSPKAHYILASCYFIMMFFGLIGNALVIVMFARCRSLRTPANTLVINLALSDFIILTKAPIFIYNSLYLGPALGEWVCRLYGFVGGLCGTASIITLTMIAIDRYNVVVYPLNPMKSTTKMRSRIMIGFVWIYSVIFATPPLLEIGFSKYVPEGYLTSCSFDYLDRTPKARLFMLIYFVFAWVVPFVLITYCYIHILRVVILAKRIQSNKEKNKTEVKLALVVIAIIALWFFAWTPYAVVALLGISDNEAYLTPLASMIPAILCKISACIDPYFYAVTHPRFRAELRRLCGSKLSNRKNSQLQTSHYSRGGTSRGHGIAATTDHAAMVAVNVGHGGRHSRINSLAESSLSVSLDYSSDLEAITLKTSEHF